MISGPDYTTTWEKEINERRDIVDDHTPIVAAVWRPLIAYGATKPPPTRWTRGDDITILEGFLGRSFDGGYGGVKGEPFVVWTERYVYFPAAYAGAEWAEAVPLNPDTPFWPEHVG